MTDDRHTTHYALSTRHRGVTNKRSEVRGQKSDCSRQLADFMGGPYRMPRIKLSPCPML